MRFSPTIARIPAALTGALAGWTLLVGGMLLLAAVILTPAWLECNELRWQQHTLRLQALSLAEQAQAYRQFHHAVTTGDPVVIERLAYTELGLKPAGTTPLLTHAGANALWSNSTNADRARAVDPTALPDLNMPERSAGIAGLPASSIAAWLHRPVPRVGIEVAAYQPVRSWLTRITTSGTRPAIITAALACLIAGMFLPTNPSRRLAPLPRR